MLPANSSVMNQLPEGDARGAAPAEGGDQHSASDDQEPSGESPYAEELRQG